MPKSLTTSDSLSLAVLEGDLFIISIVIITSIVIAFFKRACSSPLPSFKIKKKTKNLKQIIIINIDVIPRRAYSLSPPSFKIKKKYFFSSSQLQMGVLDPSQQDKETLMSTLMTSVSVNLFQNKARHFRQFPRLTNFETCCTSSGTGMTVQPLYLVPCSRSSLKLYLIALVLFSLARI